MRPRPIPAVLAFLLATFMVFSSVTATNASVGFLEAVLEFVTGTPSAWQHKFGAGVACTVSLTVAEQFVENVKATIRHYGGQPGDWENGQLGATFEDTPCADLGIRNYADDTSPSPGPNLNFQMEPIQAPVISTALVLLLIVGFCCVCCVGGILAFR